MGLFSRFKRGQEARPRPVATMGIAGHGMLIAPACPCRVARVLDLLVIDRRASGPLTGGVAIKLGTAPATRAPARQGPDAYTLGPDGPTIALQGVALDDALLQVDVGLGESPWMVLVPGVSFGIPKGMMLYSPDEQGGMPELHHGLQPGALVQLAPVGRPANTIAVRAPDGSMLQSEEIELGETVIRFFGHDYEHDGNPWRQHQYAVPLDDAHAIVLTAQAPVSIWDDVERAALEVAASLVPLTADA
ncbi:MAG TPA: hypothetical protein VLX92_00960 [Kofleriaceae bacterium]|nr:hypothetical protein [Kofleriaceae bacterium]